MKIKVLAILSFLFFLNFHISGQNFETLGSGLRVTGIVNFIEMDTINNRMFVAGSFSQIDDFQCSNLAFHDSLGWHQIGSESTGNITSMKYVNGRLYIAGSIIKIDDFVIENRICYWDSSGWHNMDGGVVGEIYSMEYYNSMLYVSGSFSEAGGIPVNGIAAWDGNSWSSIGQGSDYLSVNLKILDNKLFAYGRFNSFNGIATQGICFFDGVNWSSRSLNDTNRRVQNITTCGNQLYASTYNLTSFRTEILLYNGISWDTILSNLASSVVFPFFSFQDSLYVFTYLGVGSQDSMAINVYSQNGQPGSEFISTTNNAGVNILSRFAKSIDGVLYVGGNFRSIDNQFAAGIIVINNNSVEIPFYTSTGKNISENYAIGYGMILDSITNELIVVGKFDFAGDTIANSVAKWDGTKWSPMGSGFSCVDDDSYAQSIVKYNGQIYVCGRFEKAGNKIVNNIAVWNGTEWDSVGAGANNQIYEMVVYDGLLYVIGKFTTFNGMSNVHGFVKYDGNVWSAFPSLTINGNSVNAICVHDNKLIITGSITISGVVSRFAQFDGISWSAFPSPGNGLYYPIISINGNLYAGATNYVYKYNGSNWTSVINIPSGGPAFYLGSFTDMVIVGSGMNSKTYMLNAFGQQHALCHNLLCYSVPIDSNSAYVSGIFSSLYPTNHIINNVAILRRQQPSTLFTPSADTICHHEYINFNTETTDFIKTYDWTFPGGIANVSIAQSPSIKYTVPGIYDVRYKVTNAFGSDSVFFPQMIHVNNCTVSTYELISDEFTTYPNPVNDFLTVHIPNSEKWIRVNIYNALGQKELEYSQIDISQSQEFQLNFSNFKQGIYIIIMDTENQRYVTKISKN